MSFQNLSAALVAALTLTSSPVWAEGHSNGLVLDAKKSLCDGTKHWLKHQASGQHRFTAYVSTITSEQAAASCITLTRENRVYGAHANKVKAFAKVKALEECVLDNRAKEWCVLIGVVRNQ